MVNVSWNNAQKFCTKTGFRLPSEAEWEYACRGGVTTGYYWGEKVDGDYCWYFKNSGGEIQPVRKKKPNSFGLYDMSGNAWEFCQDEDPNSNKVTRGCSVSSESNKMTPDKKYHWYEVYLRSAGRGSIDPTKNYKNENLYLGFRLVKSFEEESGP